MKEINSYGFNMADETRKVRVEERLKIKIGEAKNLPARNNGASCPRDIYCVLSLDQEEIFRTSTIERTLNPFFGEEFQFEVPRRFRYLSIYVFDRDKHLKQDKVLGKVAIKREDLDRYNNTDHWFALRPVDADSEVQGKAYIELSLEDSRKRLRMDPKPPDPDPAPDNCSAKTKANNLTRLSEYCKESMRFGSCSSSTSKKLLVNVATEPSLNLSRSESLKDRAQWAIRPKPPMHTMAETDASPSPTAADYWSDPERHCAARVGPDTIRLRVLECSELTTKNGQCDPFALVTLLYSNGRRVEKRTKPRKKTVNPQFDEIFCFDLVMEADPKDKDGSLSPITTSAVYILGEIVSSKTEAAQPLVRLFTHHDLIVPIVKELADAEISVLTDATTIFRGNTLVSKMMDEAMRLTGAAYLRSVLRPTLAAVLHEKRPCEIDPARDLQTTRTLTLISKTIQSLGNLVSSRSAQQVCKEEYMAELYRSFCTPRHVQAIKQFLEIISTSTDTQNNSVQETPVLLKEGTMIKRSEDDTSPEEREAEAVTLREMQKVMFDLEHRHCIHRRSLARETKYGSKQAPIGDDNYLHLAGAATNVDSGSFLWRSWRGNVSPTIDLDGKALPLQPSIDICSSSESLKLARQGDERSSGKSNKSTGSGYLTMSCIKHEPSEDSDASNEKPARPPKPARLSPSRPTLTSPATPLCEYIDVDRKPPVRRPKPDLAPRRPDYEARCKEYELMANFMSHAQPEDDVPPAVPPRGNTARVRLQPKPAETEVRKSEDPAIQCNLSNSLNSLPEATHSELSFESSRRQERPLSKTDTVSNDDSLLDELQRDTYCVLKVCEDDIPDEPIEVKCGKDRKDKEEYGVFSRISLQRKSNPIKTQPKSIKPLKTSNSTSNVHDVASGSSRPLSERLTLFLKKKPKPDPKTAQSKSEDGQSGKSGRKEEKDNLIGRLTPRFGQSRLYNRGQSLDLTTDSHTRRIERSATTVSIPRPINSSIVAMKFLTLHRYGAQDEVQCRAFVQNSGEDRDVEDGAAARPEDSPRDCGGPLQYSSSEAEGLEGGAWRRNHGPLLTAATNDIRL
ncbi:unnamed protein product [Leptidea sinapis]|uniref:C2 domain-containing protein n=1 Tax=Leptidea sinapis TaxID=189913 RepID=A0A5E4PRJ5_9NEOP|nr:unnamed protein product [Leptidea sinapis]